MKVLLVLLSMALSLNSIAQSRKEQIAVLKFRIDSLNKEYVKDTTSLSNSIGFVADKIKKLSKMMSQSEEQLARKHETIASKLNTIKSLETKNLQLVKTLNHTRVTQNKLLADKDELELEIGRLLRSQNSGEYYEVDATPIEFDAPPISASPPEAMEESDAPDVMQPAPSPPPEENVISVLEEIVDFPDVEASFPCVEFYRYDSLGTIVSQNQLCGSSAMMKWISKNVNYPQTSIEMNEQGRVFLSFVVEKDGSLSNIAIERGVSLDLDREAKRVVRKMPNWIPGEASGRKVRARCRLPINFQLN
jgi:TonB family protein